MRICFIAGEIDETPKKECIKFEIEKQIINFIEDGVKFFICDFEYGSGIEFAEVLVNLKKSFPQIHILAFSPYDYSVKGDKETLRKILNHCSAVDVVYPTSYKFWKRRIIKFINRNKAEAIIVFNSDINKKTIYIMVEVYLNGGKTIIIDSRP